MQKNNKIKILVAAICITTFMNIKSSFASEEIINYDKALLDQVFVEDSIDSLDDKKTEDISNDNITATFNKDLIEDDKVIESSNYLDNNIDNSCDLPVVMYDDSNLDDILEAKDSNPPNKVENPKGDKGELIDGKLYIAGEIVNNSWVDIGSDRYYADANGNAVVGYTDISGKKYYFNKDNTLLRNSTVIADGGKYNASSEGILTLVEKASAGRASLGEKSYYFSNNGNLVRGLTDLGENRYYFDKVDGLMLRNKIINDGLDKIHTAGNGVAHFIGRDYHNGKLGYFNENGTFTKGVTNIDGMTYGFDDNGKLYNRQNKNINGQRRYFNKYGEGSKTDGSFYKGRVGDRYYFADGKPAEGFQIINGKNYIFDELTLEKLTNDTKVFNHKRYNIDQNGIATYVGNVSTNPAEPGTRGLFAPGFSEYLNRKTPYFTQNDARWKNLSYSGGTYSGYGCGPTAMAMVLNRKLNRNDIYPTTTAIDAAPYTANEGTDRQYLIEGAENYGFKSYEVPVNEKAFIEALRNNPIIVRVGDGYFINAGHYMVIDSYKDGYFIINDPYYSIKNTKEAHPFRRLKQEVTVARMIK